MPEQFIKTIHKVRVAGNRVEFWFQEDLKTVEDHHTEIERFIIQEGFHACIKLYMFIGILQEEEIYSDVLTSGLKHRKTVWKYSKHKTHLEFVSFLGETRIVLIEKFFLL